LTFRTRPLLGSVWRNNAHRRMPDTSIRRTPMRLNTHRTKAVRTHEGAPAYAKLSAEQRLRRSVMSCLLWEDEFYEDGQSIADRIVATAMQVTPQKLAALAVEAREVFHLRHVPLLLLEVLSRTGKGDRLPPRTRP